MPYTNKWESKGLHRTFTGTITGREVLNSNLSVQGDSRFDEIRYVLNDFTGINGFDISDLHVEEVSTIDNVAAKANSQLKIIIVANDPGFLKFVEMYLAHMENSPFEIVVFHEMETALKSIT